MWIFERIVYFTVSLLIKHICYFPVLTVLAVVLHMQADDIKFFYRNDSA